MNWARVGALCVCVRELNLAGTRYEPLHPREPKVGEVLTIREIYTVGEKVGFCFEEIVSAINRNGREQGFDAIHFRPVNPAMSKLFQELVANPKMKVET